ncbi:MAG: HAD family hydrolase [Anaerolineae bacterium]|nr:HAD family hydrolase [Anaerolineae bacterium]
MPVRGIIFDMGGTLLHYNAPNTTWEDTEKLGARGVYRTLRAAGYTLPPADEAITAAWQHAITTWKSIEANYNPATLKLHYQLHDLARLWGTDELPTATVDAITQAYMTAIQRHVYPLDHAAETLQTLRDNGYRIGLISNTVWPGSAHYDDLDRFGLLPYLAHLTFSADVEAWKPYAEIFQIGLAALDLTPDEAIYVGDSLYFDVWGAQQAGLRGVWIEQDHRWLPEGMADDVVPAATIKHLPDLLGVVEQWSRS